MKLNFKLVPRINKSNGQVNVSIPKKKMPKEMLDDISNIKELDFILEGWR
jgi:hypothetical protein